MRLTVVRHGKTHQDPPEDSTGRDEDRVLKSRGVRQSNFLGEFFAQLEHPPRLIVSSGIERAITTAKLINDHLGVEHRVDSVLEFGPTPSQAIEAVIGHASDTGLLNDPGGIMTVGHNPQSEGILGLLLSGAGATGYRVRTGEAFALEVDPEQPFGTARLLWSERLEE
jgi:phosphohistidine phosphatase SixA